MSGQSTTQGPGTGHTGDEAGAAAAPGDAHVDVTSGNSAIETDGATQVQSRSDGAGGVGVVPENRNDASGGVPSDAGADPFEDGWSDASVSDAGSRPRRVLLYHFSTLTIASVPQQLAILKQTLEGWNYQVDESQDPAVFTDAGLAQYSAVAMVNTCFYPFGANQNGSTESLALERFLKLGGGLFGTHCAAVTFQSAQPPALYNQLIGGRGGNGSFDGKSDCRKLGDHPTNSSLPETFQFVGNLDNTDYLASDITVLVKCKWGQTNGNDVAVSWLRTEGEGRVFYSNFAKVDSDLTDATVGEKHLLRGLSWVLGL